MNPERIQMLLYMAVGALMVICALYAWVSSRGAKGGVPAPPTIEPLPDTEEARYWYGVRFGGEEGGEG